MLSHCADKLSRLSMGLASTSPRRIDMFNMMNLKFTQFSSTYEEDLDREAYSPQDFVKLTAYYKAEEVFRRASTNIDIMIGADTMVVPGPSRDDAISQTPSMSPVLASRILGKPKTRQEAYDMLSRLSGTYHYVISGVSIIIRIPHSTKFTEDEIISRVPGIERVIDLEDQNPNYSIYRLNFSTRTDVTFCEIPKEVIEAYVASGEPMDKAGSYGYQGVGGSFVTKIEGCSNNVIGFPLHAFCQQLLSILSLFE